MSKINEIRVLTNQGDITHLIPETSIMLLCKDCSTMKRVSDMHMWGIDKSGAIFQCLACAAHGKTVCRICDKDPVVMCYWCHWLFCKACVNRVADPNPCDCGSCINCKHPNHGYAYCCAECARAVALVKSFHTQPQTSAGDANYATLPLAADDDDWKVQ